jgi:hypothetical protein
MRRVLEIVSLVCLMAAVLSPSAMATTGSVAKVLPQLLDLKGRHALTPSLYDRDAYQAQLRQHPDQVSGVCFQVKWRAVNTGDAKLKLRIEIRGEARGKAAAQTTLEKEVQAGKGSIRWTPVSLTGDEYKKIGAVTAWRVTLWSDDQMLGEQKSFLW